jgi:hypothetical protein
MLTNEKTKYGKEKAVVVLEEVGIEVEGILSSSKTSRDL